LLAAKLSPQFLQKCKVFEDIIFKDLIPSGTIEYEFVNFLQDTTPVVKNMNEKTFLAYVINIESDLYPNFIRYSEYMS
jgi:hypothetical protein